LVRAGVVHPETLTVRKLLAAAGIGAVVCTPAPALAQDGGTPSLGSGALVWVGVVAVVGSIVLIGYLFFGSGSAVERDVRRRLGRYAGEPTVRRGWIQRIPLLRRLTSEAEQAAAKRGLLHSVENALEQADLPVKAGEAITGALVLSVLVGFLAGVFTTSMVIGAITVVIALLITSTAIQALAARERRRFEAQLPDTLTLLSTSIRAGFSLLQSVEAVAQESPEPTRREFTRALTEIRLGRQVAETLREIAERMQSIDFEWAVMAIEIQREVGGNLAEVLQTAAETMMERGRLRREVKALTAEGRMSAIVLGVLPFGLFAFLWVTNRDYLEPLTSSAGGLAVLGGSVLLLGAGVYWLSRIVKVEV
jgi:tight adherence protein B